MRFSCLLLLSATLVAEIGYVKPWGKGSNIQQSPPTQAPSIPLSLPALLCEKLIIFHQSHLSKTTGPRSHFRPTSSHYTLEAIRLHGFVRGWLMGCDRLMRENPEPWIYPTYRIDRRRFKWDPPIRPVGRNAALVKQARSKNVRRPFNLHVLLN